MLPSLKDYLNVLPYTSNGKDFFDNDRGVETTVYHFYHVINNSYIIITFYYILLLT